MSQKNIESTLQSKLRTLNLNPKQYNEVFNQFFTEEVKEKVKQIIDDPKVLLPAFEQSKNNQIHTNLPTAKEERSNVQQEEFENSQPKEIKYSIIKQIYSLKTPQQESGFICFLKGIFFETGYINNYQPDFAQALSSYKEGVRIQLDALCSLKLSEIYSNQKIAQKFGIKASQEIAYAYLTITNAYLDVQYDNNLINITKEIEQLAHNYEDQQKFAIDNLKKQQSVVFSNLSEKAVQQEIEQINNLLNFKFSNPEDSQLTYNQMITQIGSRDDACCLLLLIRILSNQTHNSNKQVKNIIEMARKMSLQSINQALQWLLSDATLFTSLERDHDVFNCARTSFIELFNLLKIISWETHLLVPYHPFELNNQAEYNTIHAKINTISDLIFQKKHIFKNQLHNVLIIRIRTEILRKGIGVKQSVQDALDTIEQEKELKKGEEINQNFNTSEELFKERASSIEHTIKVLSRYYLGRICSQNSEQCKQAHEEFKEAVNEFITNSDKFNQVKTFQFEILERKCQKRLENFDLSKLIETKISYQSVKPFNFDDGLTLTLKVDLVSKQSNFIFFDQSVIEVLEFVGKGEIGSTSIARIKFYMLDENESNILLKEQKVYSFSQSRSATGQFRDYNIGELVIVKQIPFNKNNYFDTIFHHLGKIQKVNSGNGLLQQKGFCISQINDVAFELWIIYPKLDYNLYAILKQNLLYNESMRISFALQLAESLKNLHENNSYHGNIKPSNILMDSQQKAFFNDWEFTNKMYQKERQQKNNYKSIPSNEKQLESPNIEDDDSIAKNPLYNHGYIAPEIYLNPQNPLCNGQSADIFSLGMIFYYLFTNKDPCFCGLIQEQKLYNNNNLKISSETIQNKHIRHLIEGMTKFDPQERTKIQKIRDSLINQCLLSKTKSKEINLEVSGGSGVKLQ